MNIFSSIIRCPVDQRLRIEFTQPSINEYKSKSGYIADPDENEFQINLPYSKVNLRVSYSQITYSALVSQKMLSTITNVTFQEIFKASISIFFISNNFSQAPGVSIMFSIFSGFTCHDNPYLSLHHPQTLSAPPSEVSLFQ
jgi:hypothetical protein